MASGGRWWPLNGFGVQRSALIARLGPSHSVLHTRSLHRWEARAAARARRWSSMHAARSRRATRVSWIRTDLARGLFVMREAISMQLEVHSWIRTDRARGRGMTILHVLDRPRRSGKIRRRSKIRDPRSKIRRATHSREIARSGAVPRSARFLVILAPRRAQVRALARAHQRCAGSREVYLQSTGPSSAPRRALRALPLRPSKVNESVSPFLRPGLNQAACISHSAKKGF